MEATNVLKEYLELFTADCRQLKLVVAPNAVVDWFGRTVRGPANIHDYLRFEVGIQYEHADFDKAEECQQIEQRPSHWKTKSLPTGDVDFVLPLNKVTGLTSLKTYADSDLEDDDLEMQPLPSGTQTPEPQSDDIAHIGELTPPSSTIKIEHKNLTDSESDSDDVQAPKRLKRSVPTPFSYLRRMPTSSSKITRVLKRQPTETPFDMPILGDDTSSDEETDADLRKKLSKEYTPLKYISAIGVLRAKPLLYSTGESPPTPHRTNDWDRPARLRISYRRNLTDQSLQIALVIYEHLTNNSAGMGQDATAAAGLRRRNLMAEFNETAALNETPNPTNEDVVTEIAGPRITESSSTVTTVNNVDEESTAISAELLRTPTKNDHTPPATPKRRPRVPYTISGMKRIGSTPTSSTQKRSAARTLRL
uniref:Uncharacterized protein n=1 Tax=Ceratitis capitata TaxID=7213 RepID=W8BJJ0_CERCA